VKSQALKPTPFRWFDYSRYSFSLGLESGGVVYLSGHSASEHDAGKGAIIVRGGMAEQARTAWAKIEAILAAGGCTLADIVRVVDYVTVEGIAHYAEAERIRREMLGTARPALNTVVVNRLLRPQALIEVEVTARKGESDTTVGQTGQPSARSCGGIVYLSSLLPIADDGGLVASGDVAAQTRAIFERAARVLSEFELGLSDIVKTVDYLAPGALAEYKRTAEVRRECFEPVFPAATGIVMPRLARSDALIQIDLIASRHPRAIINPGWTGYAALTYSPAVLAGNLLFIAGQAAVDPNTGRSVHPYDIGAQSAYIYENTVRLIASAGGALEHLVKTIEYVTPAGLAHYSEVAGVRRRKLHEPLPASTGVVCERLLRPEFQLEVDSFAVID
jgi:enamine deaminase RidA (YjgF/YER057c/UK114 family)